MYNQIIKVLYKVGMEYLFLHEGKLIKGISISVDYVSQKMKLKSSDQIYYINFINDVIAYKDNKLGMLKFKNLNERYVSIKNIDDFKDQLSYVDCYEITLQRKGSLLPNGEILYDEFVPSIKYIHQNLFRPVTVGERFWASSAWSTSGVVEIIDEKTFKTHNSVYEYKIKKL